MSACLNNVISSSFSFQGQVNCPGVAWILIPGDLANNAVYCGAYLNTFSGATMAISGAVRREFTFTFNKRTLSSYKKRKILLQMFY